MKKEYIINITFIVEPPAHTKWYAFIEEKFAPYLRENGYGELLFTRVLSDERNPHYTYSLQIKDSTVEDYQRFTRDAINEYSTIAHRYFGEHVLHHISLLKIINL
ncbi:hypothetical protein BN938_1181 [Mucinivorans hirudinis]|uniref:DUF4286 domain-containing protein n=1 Tax=Mucinivorans hirudinis TaxID=1433126 RepID=A0A060R7M0_9BACT|nr:hypothetical protein BN938_1181 [Mucinivorans hirudinis]